MDVISGRAGSSENCALQGRPPLSFQLTSTESDVEVTWIEPGPGPAISKGTVSKGAAAIAIHADESRTTIDFIWTLLPAGSQAIGRMAALAAGKTRATLSNSASK
jgi:hypothetical protein